mmetsp:Transcript_34040/g.38739  ORF Transcript_34040/g.38739 Transcript_34040/m.38739 type:complete len:83 (+) Transcript_34040:656-904(+)
MRVTPLRTMGEFSGIVDPVGEVVKLLLILDNSAAVGHEDLRLIVDGRVSLQLLDKEDCARDCSVGRVVLVLSLVAAAKLAIN